MKSKDRLHVQPSEHQTEDCESVVADDPESERSKGVWEECLENLGF